jgi:hypothetical protein
LKKRPERRRRRTKARTRIGTCPATRRVVRAPEYGGYGNIVVDPLDTVDPPPVQDPVSHVQALVAAGRRPQLATRHSAPCRDAHARMQRASWPRYALRRRQPRPRRPHAFALPDAKPLAVVAVQSARRAPLLPPTRSYPFRLSPRYTYPFPEFPCVTRPRRRREFQSPALEHQAWRVPPLRAVKGSSPTLLPAGLRLPRKQVSLLMGSSHPTGRGWPHIAGRPPPLCRQGPHCKALDLHKVFFAN